jgi:hypothetical protein
MPAYGTNADNFLLEVDSTLRTEEIARMLNARTNRIVALDCQWKVCRKLFYAMQKQQYRVCIQCSNNALQEHDAIARPVKTHLVSNYCTSANTQNRREKRHRVLFKRIGSYLWCQRFRCDESVFLG